MATPRRNERFPGYDVLSEAHHWDEKTREVVLARVNDVPRIEFFTDDEVRVLEPFVDVVMAQDEEPKIPLLNFIDEKCAKGAGVGYRYYLLPDDEVVWRIVARGLQEAGFAGMALEGRQQFVDDFAQAKLHGEPWSELNVAFVWEIVHRDILSAYYSHPWAWNEIGFGGPAYPRGYSRFGSPHLENSERETWEPHEAFNRNPGHLREGLD